MNLQLSELTGTTDIITDHFLANTKQRTSNIKTLKAMGFVESGEYSTSGNLYAKQNKKGNYSLIFGKSANHGGRFRNEYFSLEKKYNTLDELNQDLARLELTIKTKIEYQVCINKDNGDYFDIKSCDKLADAIKKFESIDIDNLKDDEIEIEIRKFVDGDVTEFTEQELPEGYKHYEGWFIKERSRTRYYITNGGYSVCMRNNSYSIESDGTIYPLALFNTEARAAEAMADVPELNEWSEKFYIAKLESEI